MSELPEPTVRPPRARTDARARVTALRPRAAVDADPVASPGGWTPDMGRPRAGRESRRPGRSDLLHGLPSDELAPVPAALDGSSERPAWAARLVGRGPWGALAERWVPEPLRGARVDPGRRGAVLLSVIAALAAVIAAVGVWWDRPEPRPITPVALAPASSRASNPIGAGPDASAGRADGGQGGSAAGNAGPAGLRERHPTAQDGPAPVQSTVPTAPTGPILVSVTGRVHDPGLIRLPAGSRVAAAITAAGGPLDPDDLTGLNLAAHLSDGDSVVVAGPSGSSVDSGGTARASPAVGGAAAGGAAVGAATSPGSTAVPVDLNTADAPTLEQLPGVGPVTAAAIIAWRTDHGPFGAIDQLQAVPGIGPAKFAQMAPHVTVR